MFDESQIDEIKAIVKGCIDDDERMDERYASLQETIYGVVTARVISTIDPLKSGGIRWYNPNYVSKGTDVNSLPWAYPISPMGGFDDSGCIWVPPAGSEVAIVFQDGDRNVAYYLGTVWDRHRGSDGQHMPYWDNYPNKEYNCLWDGKRHGYLAGDNTGDQVLPQWNDEMYNGYDQDSLTDFYSDPSQYNSITYPYIKGIKTEEKHFLKFVEGDPQCNRRWKRVELCSSRSNGLIFKDDHLHPAGQWAFGGAPGSSNCQTDGVPDEDPCCDGGGTNQACMYADCVPGSCGSGSSNTDQSTFINPYYKRQEEMRLYQGANTPMANKCKLPQSGVHLQSISGHQLAFDDSVNQPTGVPTWDRDFDFGCDDKFRGKMYMRSATGHYFEVNDTEDLSKVRSEENGFQFRTATGHFFEMNDHTIGGQCDPQDAGDRRGFTMQSTSTHLFQLSDKGLKKQHSPERMDGGIPKKADENGFEGYCLLRSGYGLTLLMKDQDRQDITKDQFILLMAPQKDNTTRGPHLLVMQEQPSGPGYVILRAGGVYYQSSYDDSIEVVGEDANPSNKFVTVTDNYICDTKKLYFNHNDFTLFLSDSYIFLLAGKDCQASPSAGTAAGASAAGAAAVSAAVASPGSAAGQSNATPCIYNAIVAKDPWVCKYTGYVHYGILVDQSGKPVLDSRSERVYISATKPPGDTQI
jgi:hypothetical protein